MSNCWDPMDCGPPASSIHGVLQARILEWAAIFLSRGSSWPRNRTQVSSIADRFFTNWATWEAQSAIKKKMKSCHLQQHGWILKVLWKWNKLEKDIYCKISLICGIKQMNKKQNKGTNQTHRYREKKSGYWRERGPGRLKWVKGINCMVTETKFQW